MDTSRDLTLQGTLIPHLDFFQEIKEVSHVPKALLLLPVRSGPLASCPLGDSGEEGQSTVDQETKVGSAEDLKTRTAALRAGTLQ